MSMMSTIESGEGWRIQVDMTVDAVWLCVDASKAAFMADQDGLSVLLTPAVIDAIRALQPRYLPHLRQQRAAIFSERARKGWETRRAENKAQQDADVKTLINMEAK